MVLTTIIMLVAWSSDSFPLFSLILLSSLRGTMFSINVTTVYRYGGSCLMVTMTSGSAKGPPLSQVVQKWRRPPFACIGDSPQPWPQLGRLPWSQYAWPHEKYARKNFVNNREVDADNSKALEELFHKAYNHSIWVLNKVPISHSHICIYLNILLFSDKILNLHWLFVIAVVFSGSISCG